MPLNPILYEPVIRQALREDLGRAGDITTSAIVPADAVGTGRLVAKETGCIAGLDAALHTFLMLDPRVDIVAETCDGTWVDAGALLARVEGPASALLAAERTALNLLGHLSGIATSTAQMVRKIASTRAVIACTRKTTPGLRALEKYAVRVGGGRNHRFGLDDAILIKENHIAMAGGIEAAVRKARRYSGHMVKIEIEVESLDQLDRVLDLPVDAVLLDNMSIEEVSEAIRRIDRRMLVEISGGLTADNVLEAARTGIDIISMGWLTHSAPSLDVSFYLSPVRKFPETASNC